MTFRNLFILGIGSLALLGSCAGLGEAHASGLSKGTDTSAILAVQKNQGEAPSAKGGTLTIEAVIINPYRTANVGSDVSGIIESFRAEEGDLLQKGQVVAKISTSRYRLIAQKAADDVKGHKLALALAERQVQLKEELLALDGTTRQEKLNAETEREIAATRLEGAKKDLSLAELNLEACHVKAPFTGYLAVKYKQPYEPVERLEKIFAIVDSAKVYAVANVPADLLEKFKAGTRTSFVDTSGQKFSGRVDKVGKLIDPKSRTKRVYVLIDNPKSDLEVGETGSLQLEER